MGSVMRRLVLALAVSASLLASACDDEAAANSGGTPQWPAGAAGRACQLLEYDVVAAQLGTRFDTAGGATKDETYTCAFTRGSEEYPYLTLSVTATTADSVIFTATFVPSGAVGMADLGQIAYQYRLAPAGSAGPATEVGWLSPRGLLLVLRYTFPATTTSTDVDALTPKLFVLAQQVEGALPT